MTENDDEDDGNYEDDGVDNNDDDILQVVTCSIQRQILVSFIFYCSVLQYLLSLTLK